ncbi:MAG: ASKHA domain-containing protein [Desulfobacteraceae bacterium]|nr:ASKHA domain-containing protein [Desulfobacteraceae bacterium]
MNEPSVRIVFLPSGLRGSVTPGTRLDQAARQIGADVQSLCGGQGKCGKCRVRIASPTANRGSLSPPSAAETEALSAADLAGGWRLACQTEVFGDVTVEVPEESRTRRQVIRKAPGNRAITPNPAIRRLQLQVQPPDRHFPMADWERLKTESAFMDQAISPVPDISVLRSLPAILRQNEGRVTMAVHVDGHCVGILKDPDIPLAGVALDIGTTSLAAHLCDLATGQVLATASAINPQVVFGEDVISRIAHASTGPEATDQLHRSIIDAVNDLLEALWDQSGISPEATVDMVCVGNPCMHHLFLGLDPSGLGLAPFVPVVSQSVSVYARDLGLHLAAGASIHWLPLVSGFVGADTIGALLATTDEWNGKTVLMVDVGTNGEIVLAHENRLRCASCATGPALEGATLRHGMRAAAGAIERVWIDPETLTVRYRVIGDIPECPVPPVGICGSGIIDAVAAMLKAGVIGPNGRLKRDLNTPRMLVSGNHLAFVLVPAEESATGRPIVIDQEDIRAVQMAKGAIHAAGRLLMEAADVKTVDKVLLCGAFGSVIDPVAATLIGLVPETAPERIVATGNAAGDGARLALLDRTRRVEAARLALRLEYLELTLHPRFQREFAMAMFFPHKETMPSEKETR